MASDSPTSASGEGPSGQQMDGETLARKALGLAVLGRQIDAERALFELKSRYSSGNYPRVSIRVLMLEGVIHYYRDRGSDSLDRVRRANVLARAAGYSDLIAETGAWMAHLAFNFEKYDLLNQGLSEALDGFEATDDTHRSRICLILADAYQFLGNSTIASQWYVNSRLFARRAKSREMMVSIEYNRVIMILSRTRVSRYLPEIRDPNFKLNWELEISSLKNLHGGLQATSLRELLLLCECYASQELSDFPRSLELLEEIRARNAAEICGISEHLLNLEIEWTRLKSEGHLQGASDALPNFEELGQWPLDDQAIGLFLLRDIYCKLGKSFDQERFEVLRESVILHCRTTDEMLFAAIRPSDFYLDRITLAALQS